jgi:hypothetical protein
MMFDEQTSDVTKQNYGFRKQEVSSNYDYRFYGQTLQINQAKCGA